MKKVIVTCAITGSIHMPSMSPHLPVTPGEIVRAAIEAAQAGAANPIVSADRLPVRSAPVQARSTYVI